MDRRQFLKTTGIITAGILIDPITTILLEENPANAREFNLNLPITQKGFFFWRDAFPNKKIGMEKFYKNVYDTAIAIENFLESKNLLQYAIVTSWYRTPFYDKCVGEARGYYKKKGGGMHPKGMAIDLKFKRNGNPIMGKQIKYKCRDWNGGMGLTYKGAGIHLDIGRERRW